MEYKRTRKGMKDKRNRHSAVDKINSLRNDIFVNPPPLPLLCEISGALHLVQPGLTAGRQEAGRQVADEMQVNFEIFKTNCIPKHSTVSFV